MTQPPDVTIVPMGLNDIACVTKIEKSAHSHPWSEKLFLSNFGKRYFNHLLIDKDRVIGYYVASSVAGEVTLMNIVIASDEQGKGFGKLLLQSLLDFSRSKNEQEIWLEVRVSNTTAWRLYEQLGFVEVGRRHDYYPLQKGREDAIIMCCHL
ncbi:ribosomal-protein-alanine acetyltransferase [Psychromonas sp. CNPT3]|uniref:ribosomal protein S18-alanine N-acetyltransferase n=1 Tax=Psychromonas sp. CNPT3 TaxID=314282 RepID=UPI00006E764E|nr:ribosomal protein S18-alanine N-acetyltransferase [Psychromonas sp. CNPT3]AGH80299.1 ribosomal-protein-alanine acetyltransferase [Psychromonas sp. CNPT3]